MSSACSWSGEIGAALEPAARAKPRDPQRNIGAQPQRSAERRGRRSGDAERQIIADDGAVMAERVETGLAVVGARQAR
jgi:hypothetical protein